MSRYIEKNYIGDAVAHLPTKILQTEHGIELVVSVIDVIEIIKSAPSIDIVLCSACRFGDDHYMHSEDSHRFEWCYEFNDVDGYCPFGKKRSEREGE